MRWFLPVVLMLTLMTACSASAPTSAPSPTVDVAATVDAAVDATRAVDRSVQATVEARAEATRAAAPAATTVPTATAVVMTEFVSTPEPYVAAPGTIEQGIEELHACLQGSEELRALSLAMMEQSGASRDFISSLLEDKELFTHMMLEVAEEDPEYASMLSLFGGMAGELCGPMAQVPAYELGMSDAEAEALLGEIFDCYNSDSPLRYLMESSMPSGMEGRFIELLLTDKGLFVETALSGARRDPEGAETLILMGKWVDAMCR